MSLAVAALPRLFFKFFLRASVFCDFSVGVYFFCFGFGGNFFFPSRFFFSWPALMCFLFTLSFCELTFTIFLQTQDFFPFLDEGWSLGFFFSHAHGDDGGSLDSLEKLT